MKMAKSFESSPLPVKEDTLRETISLVLMSDPRTQLVVNPSKTARGKKQDFMMCQALSVGYVDRSRSNSLADVCFGKNCGHARRKIWIVGSCDVTKTERAHEVVRGEIVQLHLQDCYST